MKKIYLLEYFSAGGIRCSYLILDDIREKDTSLAIAHSEHIAEDLASRAISKGYVDVRVKEVGV